MWPIADRIGVERREGRRDQALGDVLEKLMTEDAFYERLKEGFNDIFLLLESKTTQKHCCRMITLNILDFGTRSMTSAIFPKQIDKKPDGSWPMCIEKPCFKNRLN